MGGSASVLDLAQCNLSNWQLLCSHFGTNYANDQPRFERQYTVQSPQMIDGNMKCAVCGLLAVQEFTVVKKPTGAAIVRSGRSPTKGIVAACLNNFVTDHYHRVVYCL